jgi:hypothetical protein
MLAALLTTLALTDTLEVSDRTEVRVRVPGTVAAAALDVETAPTVRLTLGSRRFRVTLDEAPRLTLTEVGRAVQPAFFNGGEARVAWLGLLARLSLDETAGYGRVDFASSPVVPGTPALPPSVSPIPGLSFIPYESSATTLTSTLTLRRWAVTTSVGYELAGGATADARSLLPLETGPSGEARADYAFARRDHAVLALSASETTFSSGPEDVLFVPTLGYRHLWSRTIETTLSLGVGEARARISALSAETFDAHPVVEGVLERRTGADRQLDARASVRLGPVVNRLYGDVEERVEATLATSYRAGRLTAHAFASGSRSVPSSGPYATSLFAGELGTAYGATRVVAVDGGVRCIWQRQDATGAAFAQGTLFIGVTLLAPPLHP